MSKQKRRPSKQQQHLWNGLLVRRDEQGKWEVCPHGGWYLLDPAHAVEKSVIAELDKLYPLPHKVTLDNGDVWEWTGHGWETVDAQVNDWASRGSVACAMLDTLYRYQNQGDDR